MPARYDSPFEWLDDYLTRLADSGDVVALFAECKNLANRLDGDDIQDEYQIEMEKDGYFNAT